MKLVRPLIFSNNIRQACLPERSYYGGINPNSLAFVSGWGMTNSHYQPIEEKGEIYPKTLQYVPVPLVPNKLCNTLYSAFDIPQKLKFLFLCAGDTYHYQYVYGSCQGDSGKIHTVTLFHGSSMFYFVRGTILGFLHKVPFTNYIDKFFM